MIAIRWLLEPPLLPTPKEHRAEKFSEDGLGSLDGGNLHFLHQKANVAAIPGIARHSPAAEDEPLAASSREDTPPSERKREALTQINFGQLPLRLFFSEELFHLIVEPVLRKTEFLSYLHGKFLGDFNRAENGTTSLVASRDP